MIFAFLPTSYAAGTTNVSILYGWNGTNFVPLKTLPDGTLDTSLNLSQSIGLNPKINNTYDIGSAALLWANLYARSIRGGSGPLSLFAGGNEIITLLANGNVGIRTTSPSSALEVNGTFRSNESAYLAVTAGNVGVGTVSPGGKLEIAGTNTANNISLNVNNTLYVNNSGGGRVGVGTASPTATLSVIGNVSATSFIGNAENLTNIPYANVSMNYGYNGSDFVPLLTSGTGILKLSVTQASATNASNLLAGANGTSLSLTGNLTVLKNLSVGSTTLFVDQTGTRIGIATASPAATLEVSGTNTVNNISLNVNNTLYVNNSGGGRVGIGTTGPTDLLHIYKGASGVTPHSYTTVDIENSDNNAIELMTPNTKGSWIFFSDPEGASGQIDYSHVTDTMTLTAGGTGIMTLKSGNVGIGTTFPQGSLDVNLSKSGGDVNLTIRNSYAAENATSENVSLIFGHAIYPAAKIVAFKNGDFYSNSPNISGGLAFYTNNNGQSEKVRIAPNGNVGIGTTNPGAALDILKTSGKGLRISGSEAQADIVFEVREDIGTATSSMVINGWGNVGIGATVPSGKLHVESSSGTGLFVKDTAGSPTADYVDIRANAASNTGTALIIRSSNNADNEFYVRWDGAFAHDGSDLGAADYAEYFYSDDATLKPGELVCLVGQQAKVKRCGANDTLIGVVSTTPGTVGIYADDITDAAREYEKDPHWVKVGLLGQVPTEVAVTSGSIKSGDQLTIGANGKAIKGTSPRTLLMIALEDTMKDGKIRVLIK